MIVARFNDVGPLWTLRRSFRSLCPGADTRVIAMLPPAITGNIFVYPSRPRGGLRGTVIDRADLNPSRLPFVTIIESYANSDSNRPPPPRLSPVEVLVAELVCIFFFNYPVVAKRALVESYREKCATKGSIKNLRKRENYRSRNLSPWMNEKCRSHRILVFNSNHFLRPTIHSILILSGVSVSLQICY